MLLDISHVEEVIKTSGIVLEKQSITWREQQIPYVDLTQILMGRPAINNKHCIIMKDSAEGNSYLAVAVGSVANIQSIKEEEFGELPNIDFPFNDYFDKVYVEKGDKRCIYRLLNLVELQQGVE